MKVFPLCSMAAVAGLLLSVSVTYPAPAENIDKETRDLVKKHVSWSGNFKKFQKEAGKRIVITNFEVEYVYTNYAGRSIQGRGESTIKLPDSVYKAMTDAMYGNLIAAVEQNTLFKIVPKDSVIISPDYATLRGTEKIDTRDKMFSAKRAGSVSRDNGFESITFGPTGMKVQEDLVRGFSINKQIEIAGKLGGDLFMTVAIITRNDKKTDRPFIEAVDIKMQDINKRQKMIPFKGAVPGEFVYDMGGNALSVGLKSPVGTDVKISDRHTGFFGQTAGTFSVDGNAMASAIIGTFQKIITLQSLAMSGLL
jgi:hypothetical protein